MLQIKEPRNLDESEKKIIRELIKNPRISDNQISKNTKVPVMSVNRKRKQLEKEGLLRYYAAVDNSESGTGAFKSKQLYIIKFKIGITRKEYIDKLEKDKKFLGFNASYISSSFIGEREGHLALVLILNAESDSSLVDGFSANLIPHLKSKLGEDCVQEIVTTKITNVMRVHHNYLPSLNMENGIIKKDWPDEYIFVNKSLEPEKE